MTRQPSCSVCFETNLILSQGRPRSCAGHQPFEETRAVRLFREAVEKQMVENQGVNQNLFLMAQFLTLFDAENPCPRRLLETQFLGFDVPSSNEREIKKRVETLRRDWLLPVGTDKHGGGYWIIVDVSDFLRWHKQNLGGALTQIRTNYRVFRANFLEMAGQSTLHFEDASAVDRHFRDDLIADITSAMEAG